MPTKPVRFEPKSAGHAIMMELVSLAEPLTVIVAVGTTGLVAGNIVHVGDVAFELRKFVRDEWINVPAKREDTRPSKPVVASYFEASIFKEEDLRERARALRIAEARGLL